MSEKSSMDGSVDEIITKKLEEIHKKNQKYANRIKKAYNEVQSTKNNKKKEKFFNKVEMNISNRSDSDKSFIVGVYFSGAKGYILWCLCNSSGYIKSTSKQKP